MSIILSIIAGAVWRWWDGTNGFIGATHIKSRYRVMVGFCVVLLATVLAVGLNWWSLWVAAFAMINMQTGYFFKWEKPISTGVRFAVVGLIAVTPLIVMGITSPISGAGYVLASGIIGPVYYLGLKTSKWWGWFVGPADGFEWWARFVSGGIVIGGLSVL